MPNLKNVIKKQKLDILLTGINTDEYFEISNSGQSVLSEFFFILVEHYIKNLKNFNTLQIWDILLAGINTDEYFEIFNCVQSVWTDFFILVEHCIQNFKYVNKKTKIIHFTNTWINTDEYFEILIVFKKNLFLTWLNTIFQILKIFNKKQKLDNLLKGINTNPDIFHLNRTLTIAFQTFMIETKRLVVWNALSIIRHLLPFLSVIIFHSITIVSLYYSIIVCHYYILFSYRKRSLIRLV